MKILKFGKKIFHNLFRRLEHSIENTILPTHVEDDEKIVRAIFSPANISKKENTLKYTAFRSPADIDEVSVTRLKYSNANFCKSHAQRIKRNNDKYFGLAVLDVFEVRSEDVKGDVLASPQENNPAHADIVIGFKSVKGVQLPPQIKFRLDQLAEKARLYKDSNPDSKSWGSSLD